MTFLEVLEQVRELLQSQGRISYRALKRQFALDDEYLADLKEELLFAHPQVTDEDGRGLVWQGETVKREKGEKGKEYLESSVQGLGSSVQESLVSEVRCPKSPIPNTQRPTAS